MIPSIKRGGLISGAGSKVSHDCVILSESPEDSDSNIFHNIKVHELASIDSDHVHTQSKGDT